MTSVRSLVSRTVQELKAARALLWSPGSAADPPADRIIDVDETDVLSLRIREPVTTRADSLPPAHRGPLPGAQIDTQVSETIGTADASTGSHPGDGADLAGGPALSSPERAAGGARPTPRHVTGRQVAPRLRAGAVLLVLGLVVVVGVREAVMTRPPTVADLMALADWKVGDALAVGVNGDIPGVSECWSQEVPAAPRSAGNSGAGVPTAPGAARNSAADPLTCTGFDANIASYVAKWLGMRIVWHTVYPEQRPLLTATEQESGGKGNSPVRLDLVVAAYSITDDRKKGGVVFAGPYLETEATVLTRVGVPYIPDLTTLGRRIKNGDLAGKVCTVGTGTGVGYLVNLAGLGDTQRDRPDDRYVVGKVSNQLCVEALRAARKGDGNDVVAVVTDAALLAGFQARSAGKLIMHNVVDTDGKTVEKWGIAVGKRSAPAESEQADASGVPVTCADPDERRPDNLWARQQLVLLALQDMRAEPGSLSRWNTYFSQMLEGNGVAAAPDGPPGQRIPAQHVAAATQPVLDPKPCPVSRWPWEIGGAAGPAAS